MLDQSWTRPVSLQLTSVEILTVGRIWGRIRGDGFRSHRGVIVHGCRACGVPGREFILVTLIHNEKSSTFDGWPLLPT